MHSSCLVHSEFSINVSYFSSLLLSILGKKGIDRKEARFPGKSLGDAENKFCYFITLNSSISDWLPDPLDSVSFFHIRTLTGCLHFHYLWMFVVVS